MHQVVGNRLYVQRSVVFSVEVWYIGRGGLQVHQVEDDGFCIQRSVVFAVSILYIDRGGVRVHQVDGDGLSGYNKTTKKVSGCTRSTVTGFMYSAR